jgi:hypothetical protein
VFGALERQFGSERVGLGSNGVLQAIQIGWNGFGFIEHQQVGNLNGAQGF